MRPVDNISSIGHKTLTWVQDIGLIVIAISTVVAVGIEIKVMWNNGTVLLADLLLLSYTGCFTFMKWFELLREEYKCPVVMLHVPYQAEGKITPEMRDYVVDQLKGKVIPAMEEIAGNSLPPGMSFEWTGVTYQQLAAGGHEEFHTHDAAVIQGLGQLGEQGQGLAEGQRGAVIEQLVQAGAGN